MPDQKPTLDYANRSLKVQWHWRQSDVGAVFLTSFTVAATMILAAAFLLFLFSGN